MGTDFNKEIQTYLEQKPENLQQIATRLIEIVLASHPGMQALIRWGKPTFGLNGDFHHWICAVQVLKNRVSLIFHFGGLLCDENNRLIAGTSKFLRKIEFDRLDRIDESEILTFIEQAIEKLPYFKDNWKELNKKWKETDNT